ncbi:MAG TPA: helix-turn-helix domain-containing protein, partial [Anaerolineales bacterium]
MAGKESDVEPLDPNRLLNAREAARILHVSRSLIYWLIAHGDLPTVRIRRALRFRFQDIQAYIETTA